MNIRNSAKAIILKDNKLITLKLDLNSLSIKLGSIIVLKWILKVSLIM
jgi:hypothetical protein